LGGDPSAMETRQAEFAEQSGSADFQTVAMSNAVIRLLEEKTGQAPAGNFGLFGSAVTAVSQATGLSEDDVRAGLSEGQTLAQILAANGGDVDAVAAQLAESLADSPQLQGQDAQEAVTNLLQGGQPSTDQSPQE